MDIESPLDPVSVGVEGSGFGTSPVLHMVSPMVSNLTKDSPGEVRVESFSISTNGADDGVGEMELTHSGCVPVEYGSGSGRFIPQYVGRLNRRPPPVCAPPPLDDDLPYSIRIAPGVESDSYLGVALHGSLLASISHVQGAKVSPLNVFSGKASPPIWTPAEEFAMRAAGVFAPFAQPAGECYPVLGSCDRCYNNFHTEYERMLLDGVVRKCPCDIPLPHELVTNL